MNNSLFPQSVFFSFPLLSSGLSNLCITMFTSLFLSLSPLSGSASRECNSLGGGYGSDLLPPAELRWINRGHPESPPPDSLLQRHARCVSACTLVSADKPNLSLSMYLPLVTFKASLLDTLAVTHQHFHFTFFFSQMSSFSL